MGHVKLNARGGRTDWCRRCGSPRAESLAGVTIPWQHVVVLSTWRQLGLSWNLGVRADPGFQRHCLNKTRDLFLFSLLDDRDAGVGKEILANALDKVADGFVW